MPAFTDRAHQRENDLVYKSPGRKERRKARKLPVEITGSDYIPTYIHHARAQARRRGVPATFRLVNAFDMTDVDVGAYDIVFICQSIHHFTAGQLAMMMAQSARRATTAFVGIDGFRSLLLLGLVPGIAALTLRPSFVHDAWITARRLFSQSELRLVGRLACPSADVQVFRHDVGFSVVQVRFSPRPA